MLYRLIEIQKKTNTKNNFRRSLITRHDLNQISNILNIVVVSLLKLQKMISNKIVK